MIVEIKQQCAGAAPSAGGGRALQNCMSVRSACKRPITPQTPATSARCAVLGSCSLQNKVFAAQILASGGMGVLASRLGTPAGHRSAHRPGTDPQAPVPRDVALSTEVRLTLMRLWDVAASAGTLSLLVCRVLRYAQSGSASCRTCLCATCCPGCLCRRSRASASPAPLVAGLCAACQMQSYLEPRCRVSCHLLDCAHHQHSRADVPGADCRPRVSSRLLACDTQACLQAP